MGNQIIVAPFSVFSGTLENLFISATEICPCFGWSSAKISVVGQAFVFKCCYGTLVKTSFCCLSTPSGSSMRTGMASWPCPNWRKWWRTSYSRSLTDTRAHYSPSASFSSDKANSSGTKSTASRRWTRTCATQWPNKRLMTNSSNKKWKTCKRKWLA